MLDINHLGVEGGFNVSIRETVDGLRYGVDAVYKMRPVFFRAVTHCSTRAEHNQKKRDSEKEVADVLGPAIAGGLSGRFGENFLHVEFAATIYSAKDKLQNQHSGLPHARGHGGAAKYQMTSRERVHKVRWNIQITKRTIYRFIACRVSHGLHVNNE